MIGAGLLRFLWWLFFAGGERGSEHMADRVANPECGEVEVVLLREGRELRFVLRPTFEAVTEIETRTGKSILRLGNELMADSAMSLSLSNVMVIVRAGLRASGEKYNEKALQAMVFETGILRLAGPCGAFLSSAIRGGKPALNNDGREAGAEEAAAAETAADTPSGV